MTKIKYRIVFGDPSNDGHGQHDEEHLLINGTSDDIKAAFKKLKDLGLDFHNICRDYEDSQMTVAQIDALEKLGLDVSYLRGDEEDELDEDEIGYVDGTEHFCKIIVESLNKVSPELEVEIIKQEYLPSIGTFGYGLFN